jgi:hypothetical protein
MKRRKWYVGHSKAFRTAIAFATATPPQEPTHGSVYSHVTGPFRTKRGAKFMAKYGRNNPHCQTVAQAERLAKEEIRDQAEPYA